MEEVACSRALHTPPPHVVCAGIGAVLQFPPCPGFLPGQGGESASHLVKVMLLGDQCVGKSSLADSLSSGAPRAASDRTVGIDVRR